MVVLVLFCSVVIPCEVPPEVIQSARIIFSMRFRLLNDKNVREKKTQ